MFSQTEEITIGGKDKWFASVADFFSFCNSMSGVPSISDGPFNPKHENSVFGIIQNPEEDHESVRVFITTPGLIVLASQRNFIQTGATSDILIHGHHTLICGNLDIENNFCPFGICICPGKTEADFSFMFSAVQKALRDINQPCSVSMLIAEKNEAIWEAFKIAF